MQSPESHCHSFALHGLNVVIVVVVVVFIVDFVVFSVSGGVFSVVVVFSVVLVLIAIAIVIGSFVVGPIETPAANTQPKIPPPIKIIDNTQTNVF